jgi:hypothetical protein
MITVQVWSWEFRMKHNQTVESRNGEKGLDWEVRSPRQMGIVPDAIGSVQTAIRLLWNAFPEEPYQPVGATPIELLPQTDRSKELL